MPMVANRGDGSMMLQCENWVLAANMALHDALPTGLLHHWDELGKKGYMGTTCYEDTCEFHTTAVHM